MVASNSSGKRFEDARENLKAKYLLVCGWNLIEELMNYQVMLIRVAVRAMDPSVNRLRCMPFGAVVARNAIDPDANFPISLDASILPDDSGTKPGTKIE